MYYNLSGFGNKVKKIRKNLSFSQSCVAELTGISVDTLGRIELGQVVPKRSTLESLSVALRIDLNQILLEHRMDNYDSLMKIKKQILAKCELADYSTLSVEACSLQELLATNMSQYYRVHCKQLLLYCESIMIKPINNDFSVAIDLIEEALILSITDFKLSRYDIYRYNDFELFLLASAGLALRHTDGTKTSYDVLKFCYDYFAQFDLSSDLVLYERLCYNLSYACHRLGVYEEALQYSSAGVEYCNKKRSYSVIGLLYARKGIAEHLLNDGSGIDSLRQAKHFLEFTNHKKNLEMLIIACKKNYGIDLLNLD
ncbi:MAG: helix-turn-helix domain-containing protein [Alkaliphilus sp.]